MSEQEDWKDLSISQKLAHKNWKARIEGFNQLEKKIVILDEGSGFGEYIEYFKRLPFDTNIPTQERGFEVILKILSLNSATARNISKDVSSGIVSKCLTSKPKLKQTCVDVLLQLVECDEVINVVNALREGLALRQPKIISSCIDLVTTAIREFGPKVIPFKELFKESIKLLEHGDKGVRESEKLFIVELYRWLKDSVKMMIVDIKPMQREELEKEFNKIASDKATPTRFIGGIQPQSTAISHELNAKPEVDNVKEELSVDPYELIDPVDVISKIPANFFTDILETKWQIRKEALENLEKILNVQKIQNGDFSELLNVLKRVISTDANINIVSLAVKCIGNIGQGLKKSFSSYSHQFLPIVCEKFKEKRGSIVENCRTTVDALSALLDFDSVSVVIFENLKNKSPSIREEMLKFMTRTIKRLGKANLNKSQVKSICQVLSKTVEDSSPAIRELGYEVLSTLMEYFGDKIIFPYLEGLDESKLNKLRETFEKIKITSIPANAPVMLSSQSNKQPNMPQKGEQIEKKDVVSLESKNKRESKKEVQTSKVATNPPSIVNKPLNKPKNASDFSQDQNDPGEIKSNDSEAMDLAKKLIGNETAELLSSSNWKERLQAHEQLSTKIEQSSEDPSVVYSILNLKPGWKETNFQILKLKYMILSVLSKKQGELPLVLVHHCAKILADKISDPKLKDQVYITLTDLCDVSSLNYVCFRVGCAFQSSKNIKNQIDTFLFFSHVVLDYGPKLDLKYFINLAKKTLDLPNPDLKKAVITFLSTLYRFIGVPLRTLIEDLKPAILQNIDVEFAKAQELDSPIPTRGDLKPKQDNAEGNEGKDEDISESTLEVIDAEDLITRVDISSQLSSELFLQMNDKNWKIRNESLENISGIIKSAKYISPNIGELPIHLSARLSDTNKNLIIITLNILNDLINSMGKSVDQFRSNILPNVFLALSDGKVHVRKAASVVINSWVAVCGLTHLLDSDDSVIVQAYKNNSSVLKQELNEILIDLIPKHKAASKQLNFIIPSVITSASDRNADTRRSAQNLLIEIGKLCGMDSINKIVNKLDSVSQNAIKMLIENVSSKIAEKTEQVPTTKLQTKSVEINTKKEKDIVSNIVIEAEKASIPVLEKKLLPNQSLTSSKIESKKEEISKDIIYRPNTKISRFNDKFYKHQSISKDFVASVCSALQLYMSSVLHSELYSPDFKKQMVGMQNLNQLLENVALNGPALLECSDLLICYAGQRLTDGNPSVLLKTYEFLEKLFNFLIQSGVKLTPDEALSILPPLIDRLGEKKEVVRKQIQSLISRFIELMDVSLVINHLMGGFSSKASTVRSESLNLICKLISSNSLMIFDLLNSQKLCQETLLLLQDKDSLTRNAALNFSSILYSQIGEKINDYTTSLSSKELGMLKERIKRLPKPNLDKTFCVSNNQSFSEQESSASNKSLNISVQSPLLNKTVVVEQIMEPKLFDINSYLQSNGIYINEEPLKSVEINTEFDPQYVYKPIDKNKFKPQECELLQLEKLNKCIRSDCVVIDDVKKAVSELTLIHYIRSVPEETLLSAQFCFHNISNYLFNHSKINGFLELLKSVFDLLTLLCFWPQFMHYLENQSVYEDLKCMFKIMSINHDASQLIHSVCKSILVLFCQFIPIEKIVDSLLKLSIEYHNISTTFTNKDLIYCLEIVQSRLKRHLIPSYMNIDNLLNVFNDSKYLSTYAISLSGNDPFYTFKIHFDQILALLVSNNEFESNTISKYSVVQERLSILKTEKNFNRSESIEGILESLCQKLIPINDRLECAQQIIYLSVEHNISFLRHRLFSELPPYIRFFIRGKFILLPSNRVNAIFSSDSRVQTSTGQITEVSIKEKLNKNIASINHIIAKFSIHFDSPSKDSFTISQIEPTIEDKLASKRLVSPIPKPSELIIPDEMNQSDPNASIKTEPPQNLDDLRRRFENLKNKFRA